MRPFLTMTESCSASRRCLSRWNQANCRRERERQRVFHLIRQSDAAATFRADDSGADAVSVLFYDSLSQCLGTTAVCVTSEFGGNLWPPRQGQLESRHFGSAVQ